MIAQAVDSGAAREQAREILSERRYQEPSVPRPLREPLERLGDALAPVWEAVSDAFAAVASLLPGGQATLLLLLAAAVLLLAAVVGTRLAARRGAATAGGTGAGGARDERERPEALRRAADEAERAGDLERALRLRFRAGLAELDRRRIIQLRPALSNHEVRSLGSPTLDVLLERFEEVAYGGHAAEPADLSAARDGWPKVPEEVGTP